MQFFPELLPAHLTPTYSLVIPVYHGKIVIGNIINRGWCIPSGKIEPSETPTQAAIREAREEAFITVQEPTYLGYYELSSQDSKKFATLFTAQVASFQLVKPNDEVTDRKLLSIQELPSIYYEWNPLLAEVFDYAMQIHSSNQ